MPTEADRLDAALAEWREILTPLTMPDAEYLRLRLRHARYLLGLRGSMSRRHRRMRDYVRGEVRGYP